MNKKSSTNTLVSAGYTGRAIWRIALPMMLSALSTPLVGAVDTAVMGHLDSPVFLAAVAVNTTIFSVLLMGLNFLRMGTTGVTAQAYGSASDERMTESLIQPIVIATILTAGILTLQLPIQEIALWLLKPETATQLLAVEYFDIRIWATPAVLLNFVFIGWLLGMQDAKGPLAIVLVINLSNAALDFVFVVGFGWDVAGVATATLIAEILGTLTGLLLVVARLRRHRVVWQLQHYTTYSRYLPLFRINRDLFVRSLALMFTLAFITAQGARLGNVYLATNALLMNFLFFTAYALDGIAHAAEALTGKAVGAHSRAGLELAVKHTLRWTMVFAGLFSLAYWQAGTAVINLLSDLPSIREGAITYLPWLIILPLTAAPCFLYDGVYVGTTRSREMRIVMVGSALLVFMPVWFLLRGLENHALWLALNAFMLARSASMHIWFRRLLRSNQLIAD
jgi:MATE family multidrug resistance protein